MRPRVAGPIAVLAGLLLAAGCGEGAETGGRAADSGDTTPPQPGFELLFPPIEGERMSQSSPDLADLDGDGVPDIVFGSGVDRIRPGEDGYYFADEPEIAGYVMAVSGATNELLWTATNPGEAFTTARYADLNGDGVPDVVMGGREGAFSAFSGADGAVIWRVDPAEVAETPAPYNFFSPAFLGDVDGDGVDDMVVVYGGDDTKQPGDPRDPAYITVISGADGTPLHAYQTPDGRESYSSVVLYERPDGARWLVFGTGGETEPGAAYRAPVASLLDGTFPERVERLVEPGEKGVIAPATLVELTGDEELDLVISTFGGRLIALDGASGDVLWAQREEGEEAYHQPAVVRLGDGRLGFFLSRGIGTFPRYAGTVHRLYDADGELLFEHRNGQYPGGAPLAVDLTGDGVDEPLFFSQQYPFGEGGRIHVLHVPTEQLVTHDVSTNLAATPAIGDPRGTGSLELMVPTWFIAPSEGPPDWSHLRWRFLRIDLSAPPPPFMAWAGYMGTDSDGHFRPAPQE